MGILSDLLSSEDAPEEPEDGPEEPEDDEPPIDHWELMYKRDQHDSWSRAEVGDNLDMDLQDMERPLQKSAFRSTAEAESWASGYYRVQARRVDGAMTDVKWEIEWENETQPQEDDEQKFRRIVRQEVDRKSQGARVEEPADAWGRLFEMELSGGSDLDAEQITNLATIIQQWEDARTEPPENLEELTTRAAHRELQEGDSQSAAQIVAAYRAGGPTQQQQSNPLMDAIQPGDGVEVNSFGSLMALSMLQNPDMGRNLGRATSGVVEGLVESAENAEELQEEAKSRGMDLALQGLSNMDGGDSGDTEPEPAPEPSDSQPDDGQPQGPPSPPTGKGTGEEVESPMAGKDRELQEMAAKAREAGGDTGEPESTPTSMVEAGTADAGEVDAPAGEAEGGAATPGDDMEPAADPAADAEEPEAPKPPEPGQAAPDPDPNPMTAGPDDPAVEDPGEADEDEQGETAPRADDENRAGQDYECPYCGDTFDKEDERNGHLASCGTEETEEETETMDDPTSSDVGFEVSDTEVKEGPEALQEAREELTEGES